MSEQLHRFGRDAHLCGILNMPAADVPRDGRPAVIFITAGLLHKPGPFRLHVELSRELADLRLPALRFDLSGIGESGRSARDESAEQSAVTDVCEAMDALAQETGVTRFVLVGLCSGAEVAHRTALRDERVCGMVAMDGYIVRTPAYYWRHYLPRVFSLRKWLDFTRNRLERWRQRRQTRIPEEDESLAFWGGPGPGREQLAHEFTQLCRREVRQLQIFSGGSGDCSYERQFLDAFHDVDFRGLLDVRYLAETDHTYVLETDRRKLMAIIQEWMREHFLAPVASANVRVAPAPRTALQAAFLSRLSSDTQQPAPIAGRRNIE